MTQSSKTRSLDAMRAETKRQSQAGSLLEFVREPLEFYRKCALAKGDMAFGRFGTIPICVLSHPRYVERVLVEDAGSYEQTSLLRMLLKPLLGEGLLIASEKSHQRQRPLVEKALHEGIVATWAQAVVAAAEKSALVWAKGEPRDLYLEMLQIVSEVLTHVVFGSGRGAEEASTAVERAVANATTRIREFPPIPAFVPTHDNLEYRRALGGMEKVLARAIREKREVPGTKSRLLSALVTARGERGERLSDCEIRDQIVMIYVATHQNVASALTWTIYLLASNKERYVKVLGEMESVLGNRQACAQDTEQLSFTDLVVKESLRLYPPVWQMIRRAVRETEIGSQRIRAGTEVLMSQWVLQRDARFFDEPERFVPERWEKPSQRWKFTYFPFGAGPRSCFGEGLSFLTVKLVLAVLVRRFRLSLLPGQEVQPMPAFALLPNRRLLAEARKWAEDRGGN